MAALEDFEHTLQEVVGAKRLSASKMNRLTEIAMKSLEDDTKLVAILYRTHNSLPSSAKVSSLYAFDALARAARSMVNKRGVTGDVNSEKGNATTFLLKIEGVLDGLFRDMVSLNNSESKEKTKKVLDIWVKSNTFPSAVQTRLRDILSDVRKAIFAGVFGSNEMRVSTETLFGSENAVNPTPSTNPSPVTEVATTIVPSPAGSPDPLPHVQATLLALLGQAAQGQTPPPSQTPPNMDPQLQQNQLALLQQLAHTAKLANDSPTTPPGQTPPPTDHPHLLVAASERSHLSLQPPPAGRLDGPGDTQYGRNDYADRARDQRGFRDEWHPRGGGGRGGYRGRGRRDDHHNDRFRHRDRDWNTHSRPRRSRSRSPRRHEERRNVRPYSPPHRPSNDRDQRELRTPLTASTHDKDEFGRDMRASSASPSRSTSVEDTQTLALMDTSVEPTAGATPDNHIPVSDQLPLVAASTSAQSTDTDTSSPASQGQSGLDQFDISTFDATAPSSWEGLGNMWRTTYGYPPSQEELMHYVMAESMAAAGLRNGGYNGVQGGQWQQGNWEEQGSVHHGELRGGYANSSDAIVLNAEPSDAKNDGGGGRMQRVEDKWVFVKDGVES